MTTTTLAPTVTEPTSDGLKAWAEDGNVLWSMPNGNTGTLTVRQALRFAKESAVQGDLATARILAKAIAGTWRKCACLTGGHTLQAI